MRRSMVRRWLAAGLLGAVMLGVIPPHIGVPHVHAASDSVYVTSSTDLQLKLAEGLGAREASITLKYKGPTKELEQLLKQAINEALDSDPYTKYIVDRYTYSWKGTSGYAKINLQVSYRETAEQSAYVKRRVQEILREILTPEMNVHQKVKAIHDYVVLHLIYDRDLQKYTAYEGLLTGKAVCQGYSLLTYQLLKEAGFNSMIVEGTAGGQLHAWNLVSLDNLWYHLDTTWDDPSPDNPERVRYNYYLLTDEQMRQDHQWTKLYPAASTLYHDSLRSLAIQGEDKRDVYHTLEEQLGYNLYYPNAAITDSVAMQKKVKQSLKAGKTTITVRYNGSERQLLQDLVSLYDLSIDNISYLASPLYGTDDLQVEIHWE
ncbi:transglutaminase domain-containing protein [Paenibacillus motobuensis]|uniref:Transglutaminase domain-containing protein n=1 Tax=Paenibacillus motobuensis TaxID=295324 RepID=A0ABN0YU36_9BACL